MRGRFDILTVSKGLLSMHDPTMSSLNTTSSATRSILGIALALLAAGCGQNTPSMVDAGSSPSTSDAGDAASSPVGVCADPNDIAITDDTNYSLSDDFTIQKVVLKDHTDLAFNWSQLTTDFFGKSIDPAKDINLVLLSLWNLTPDKIEEHLKADDLSKSFNVAAIMSYPDGTYTSQNLLNFTELGNPLTPDQLWPYFDTSNPSFQYPQDQYTFLVIASSGTLPGKDARMMELFTLDPNATQTELDLTNDSTKLDYTVDLARAKPVYVPAGVSALSVDWSQMTTNALGNTYRGTQITEAAVAHYANLSVADLKSQFLDLEEIADGWWSGSISAGTTVDLSGLTDSHGNTFPGIDDNGTWLVALFCTKNCNNPAPWSITFLKPCQ